MVKKTFTEAQLAALEDAFKNDPYLNAEVKATLLETGLQISQIRTWFQNTRFKRRKSKTDARLDFDTLLGTSSGSTTPPASSSEEEEKKPFVKVKEEESEFSGP